MWKQKLFRSYVDDPAEKVMCDNEKHLTMDAFKKPSWKKKKNKLKGFVDPLSLPCERRERSTVASHFALSKLSLSESGKGGCYEN